MVTIPSSSPSVPVLPSFLSVQSIPGAGRGVVATACIPAGQEVLLSGPPLFHVIFRLYGARETCGWCFHWDRGRRLRLRRAGKAFCSEECEQNWRKESGEEGIEAWETLERNFIRNSKRNSESKIENTSGCKPSKEEIEKAWKETDSELERLRTCRVAEAAGQKPSRADAALLRRAREGAADEDAQAYLLQGLLSQRAEPGNWKEQTLSLASDATPYASAVALDEARAAAVRLAATLPFELAHGLSSSLALAMARADSHNAFGIRAGGADDGSGEEYMGFAVFPLASYFNHSCCPNVAKRRRGREWSFRSARDIEAGEQCCISYLGGEERELVCEQRRMRLADVWGFECACEACRKEEDVVSQ